MQKYTVHTDYCQTCEHFCVSVFSRLPERADELSVAESVVSGGGRGPEDVSGRVVRRDPSVHGSAQREQGATRPGYSTSVPHYHHTARGPGGCARGTVMICLSQSLM